MQGILVEQITGKKLPGVFTGILGRDYESCGHSRDALRAAFLGCVYVKKQRHMAMMGEALKICIA